MAILSQLFWGVTVGALTITFTAIAKLLALGGAIAGAAYGIMRWIRGRAG
ncbi:hypothetical protein PYV00_23000 [Novosphingobium sp. H3SJ31-1]|uniref:CTP synthetase n=2 Tax=Novosphingobium album (ex Liu et al. 2023) TaxID=3031130 RepID=A0ABT5WXD4_9SPHN|nr:hypothetical protein [Novosphingobium album (ex Liu et al. 2023)]